MLPERKTIICDYEISDSDWRCIEVYRRRAVEFQNVRAQLGLGLISISFSKEQDGTLNGTGSLPQERDLKQLYLAFRFFYLQDEASNFNKVANIISKAISDSLVREAIKSIKAQWKGSFSKNLSKFHGKDYSSEKIIDCWFNAHYFHSDQDKEKALSELNNSLKGDLSKVSLFMAVFDAGIAVSNLYTAVENMGRTNGVIALPYFINGKYCPPNTEEVPWD